MTAAANATPVERLVPTPSERRRVTWRPVYRQKRKHTSTVDDSLGSPRRFLAAGAAAAGAALRRDCIFYLHGQDNTKHVVYT